MPMSVPEQAKDKDMWYTGGDLHPVSLAAAYRQGFFPWEGNPLGWCSPAMRFVIEADTFRLSRSIRRELKNNQFSVTLNQDTRAVIQACMEVPRPGQDGSWLTKEMVEAYVQFAGHGYVWSAEAWCRESGRLAGGLYGVRTGSIFVGDSMFSLLPGASKTAFAVLASHLFEQGFSMIDCQVYSDHLSLFGADEIPREEYFDFLSKHRSRFIPLQPCRLC
ncbi:leucyl/phenylalanyl-tRNA--protein transferase [Spirochaeta dissipatitropha]